MSPAFSRRHFLAAAAAVRLPRKIRVGMIGLDGHPGEVLGPLPQLPDVEVVALYDRNPDTIARFQKSERLAAARPYAHWRDMLNKEKLDVCGVCNENSEHAAAILACLKRKIHVISEKPIATELADLPRIAEAVASGGAKFTAMLPMRFAPPYLALKQIVASGEIGDVLQIDGQKSYKVSSRPEWFYHRKTYGGTMAWIGIHMIDLMLYTSGRDFVETFGYQNHIGFDETGDTENISTTIFRMDNGGVAHLRMDYLRPKAAETHGDDRLRLAGTKGIAEFMHATGVTIVTGGRKQEVVQPLPQARSHFTEFLDHIYNGKPEPIAWREIERGHQIVLKARNAMEANQVTRL